MKYVNFSDSPNIKEKCFPIYFTESLDCIYRGKDKIFDDDLEQIKEKNTINIQEKLDIVYGNYFNDESFLLTIL